MIRQNPTDAGADRLRSHEASNLGVVHQKIFPESAPWRGWVAQREYLSAAAFATLERSAGTVAHGKRAARERRRRRSKVSRRWRAGRAPPARRGRRVRVPRAFKRPAKTFGGWWWWQQLRIT